MEIAKNILLVVYIIVCVALIFITTFQSKDNSNSAEDTYEGPRGNKYFEKNKDYIYYNPVDTNSIKQVAELVKNGSIACKDIAQNGYRKAINLTFDNIATKIIANLSR